jgi:hypothetical protein
MRYYVYYNEYGVPFAIGTGLGGVEITEEEYNRLLSEIRTKATLVNQLYNEEITISEVPSEWREEIQRRVDERIANESTLEEQPISSDEFYSMLEEVL